MTKVTIDSEVLHQRSESLAPGDALQSIDGDAAYSVEAVICIPTYRRPQHLLTTLRSIERQATKVAFTVIVVENDLSRREGYAAAFDFFAQTGMNGFCVVEPQQGNCHAINRALETSLASYPTADFVLMLDDDEYAAPGWLEAMVDAARASAVDIVGGPVLPQIADAARARLCDHPAFRPAYDRSGPVPLIYGSGNFLIRRSALEAMPRPLFDLRFNLLGGGDTDFFCRARDRGLRFYWQNAAEVRETVPANRTRFGWLLQRGLRIGAINYLIERRQAESSAGTYKLALRNLVHLPLSFLRAGSMLVEGRGLAALHPITVAVGRCLAMLGIEPHQYTTKSVAKEQTAPASIR